MRKIRDVLRLTAGGMSSRQVSLVSREVGDRALDDYLRTYDEVGAHRVVLKACDLETTFGFGLGNDDVSAFCRKYARASSALPGLIRTREWILSGSSSAR